MVHNRTLLEFARHYGFLPKARRPYRAKTKGKVKRPCRYIREDFFLGGSFRNLDDLNAQFERWRGGIANARQHATTGRIIAEHFADEQPHLKPLPAGPFRAVLRLDRRITRNGMVSVGGNFYGVPDCTHKRLAEVHSLTDEVQVYEAGQLIAAHPVLEGRGHRRIAGGHRSLPPPANSATPPRQPPPVPYQSGKFVQHRPPEFYAAVAQRLIGTRSSLRASGPTRESHCSALLQITADS